MKKEGADLSTDQNSSLSLELYVKSPTSNDLLMFKLCVCLRTLLAYNSHFDYIQKINLIISLPKCLPFSGK